MRSSTSWEVAEEANENAFPDSTMDSSAARPAVISSSVMQLLKLVSVLWLFDCFEG